MIAEDFYQSCIFSAKLLGDSMLATPHLLLGIMFEEDNPLTKIIFTQYGKSYPDLYRALLKEKNKDKIKEGRIEEVLGAPFDRIRNNITKEIPYQKDGKDIRKLKKKEKEISKTTDFELIFRAAIQSTRTDFSTAIAEEFINTPGSSVKNTLKLLDIERDELATYFINELEEQTLLEREIESYCHEMIPETNDKEILGRDDVLFQIYMNLAKRTKANVILVGDAGVGKTAIVEELARQIATGECPEPFRKCKVISFDITTALAGTTLRGEFEDKIQKLLTLLSKRNDIILFIDEIHNIVGAGASSSNDFDMSNMLKPMLSRENIRVIGTTTVEELYRINKDRALARRFMPIEVKEPSKEEVLPMIQKKIELLEDYHHTRITQDEIRAIIDYCEERKSKQRFPDKAIDTVDTLMSIAELEGKDYIELKNLKLYDFSFDYNKAREENRRKQEEKIGF